MSEVKRFRADHRHVVETEFDDAQFVGVADFDRVTAERDAALEEVEALKHWRDLALQFDNQRMKALWHLKTLVSDAAHYDAAAAFLTEPPIPASELQQRLTAAEDELDRCKSMALMIEEKEWAEHVGNGPISYRVESAFTRLHNELSDSRQSLTAADERADVLEGLLRNSKDVMSGIWDASYDHEAGDALSALDLMERIDAALKPAEGGGDEAI